MNWRHCQQETPTNRQQDWRWRSKCTERCIGDKHNTPITQSAKWARRKWGNGWIVDIANKQHQQAGNEIGDEGTRALSEALKTNTTLQSLNLRRDQEESEEDEWIADIANNQHQQAGNEICEEGVRALNDAMEINTSLTSLHLWQWNSEQGQSTQLQHRTHKHLCIFYLHQVLVCTFEAIHWPILRDPVELPTSMLSFYTRWRETFFSAGGVRTEGITMKWWRQSLP